MRSTTWSHRSLAIVLLASAAAPVAAQARLTKPIIDTLPRGIVRARNSGPSQWLGVNGWKFVLEQTIAPADGSPGMLGKPDQIAVTRDGHIVVHDQAAKSLLLFGPSGAYVGPLGRIGEGPKEYSEFAQVTARGDTIGVFSDGRVLLWRADGSFIRQWTTDVCACGAAALAVLDDRGGMLTPIQAPGGGGQRLAMVRWAAGGIRGETITLPPGEASGAFIRVGGDGGAVHAPFRNPQMGTFDASLRYVHGVPSEYRVLVAAHGSDTARVIEMQGIATPIPQKIRDSVFARFTASPEIRAVYKLSDMPTHYPFFSQLYTDDEQQIWVERQRADGATGSFDVINTNGIFLGTVASPPGDALPDTHVLLTRGRMYRIGENADGAAAIQVYRVEKGAH